MRILITSLLLATTALAAEYYVDGRNGSDVFPGSKEQPFATLQKAADVMRPGDVCMIREGVYRETVRPANSGLAGLPIRFEAYAGESVTITGTDRIPSSEWRIHDGAIRTIDLPGQAVTQL
ncbi:MAG: hypothetical protein ONB12_10115, partial [candidate division KSB1 bacterium]|nr:hypothetical protein [candidate division KSB1 bacterium]